MTTPDNPKSSSFDTVEGQVELLPCPFCGRRAVLLADDQLPTWWIACECGAGLDRQLSKERVIAHWNRRASLPTVTDAKKKTLEERGDVAANTLLVPQITLRALKAAQDGIIRFLIPHAPHLDASWVEHLMEIG